MIQTIIETNVLLYAMAVLGAAGILAQWILNGQYRKLLRGAAGIAQEKQEFRKRLLWRYQMDYRRSGGQVNVPLFVRRNLLDCRFLRLNFHQWRRLAAGCCLASLLLGSGAYVYGWQKGEMQIHMQYILGMAAGVTILSVLTALWLDIRHKDQCLRTLLENYLAHSGIGKSYDSAELETAASETEAEEEKAIVEPEEIRPVERTTGRIKKAPSIVGLHKRIETTAAEEETYRKSSIGGKSVKNSGKETRAQREKRELQEQLARLRDGSEEVAAESEKKRERGRELLRQMEPKEQERIIREVLAEFLA
ncbi:MAG: hypothetical protein Q4B57_06075 [Eubacteriales bacterium]|nr:hypothetical protein [Eubacteriales bacterium]